MNADSVLDEEVWGRLTEIIQDADQLNREAFAAHGRSFGDEMKLPAQQRAGLYVWFMLRNALGGTVGGRVPTDAELAQISRDYFARISVLVDADQTTMEDVFRKVFERPPLKQEIGPAALLVLALAALGVIYPDPAVELSRIKPHLNRWWQKHSEKYHRQGLLR
jgi:hypothetical protein